VIDAIKTFVIGLVATEKDLNIASGWSKSIPWFAMFL
jgi:hypothetical protein